MRKWRWTVLTAALGLGVYALATAGGHAWEMLWLPAVMVGAVWPYEPDGTLKSCLRRLRRRAFSGRRT